MCGLCGFAFSDSLSRPEPREIERMSATLKHRGPDGQGCYVTNGVALGFRRLAIIDLSSGDQPMQNEDGSTTVVCNGEIYNYLELRDQLESRGHRFRTQSDVETIVHLYEEYGPDCVRHLRGMFAFALWDDSRKRLMLARDRFGMKPMHYTLGPHRIDFASEQKAILAANAQVDRRPDPEAIRDLFDFGFVLGARTLLRRVRRLLPGHWLLYQEGSVSIHQYWDVSFTSDREHTDPKTAAEWAEALHAKLLECVRLHMRSDVAIGALLSPGIDSSAVVALACGLTSEPIHSVTMGFDDRHLDETRRHPTLDRYPGFALTNEVIRCGNADFALFPQALVHCEEPTSIMIPRMMLCQAASQHVKVVLTGEGADEILGGYAWYRQDKLLRPFAHLPTWVRHLLLRVRPPMAGWTQQMTELFLAPQQMGLPRFRAMQGSGDCWSDLDLLAPDFHAQLLPDPGELPIRLPVEFPSWSAFQQLQYFDLKIRLPEFVNHSLDRASMASGLEARLPFLDHELVELCARMPVKLKLRGLEEKHILRHALRKTLPAEIVRRRKHGLGAPTLQWWRQDLPAFAAHALSEECLQRTGYFNPDAVRSVLERHRHGQGKYGRHLTAVLALQLKFGQ
jgi:asparagine synthase (glutamine-hydrolysing)